ncbi:MAG: nicotinamide-nucleotide amidase [Methylococcales bacterium]|nr:nicotinamide-nucleotide amidase [Methylococcaceae bacterium]
MENDLLVLADQLGQYLKARNQTIATAESCTGGWIAECITSVAGSSTWFDRGFVTYSNNAKQQMLGVRAETLEKFGAVSQETASEMVAGALAHSEADCALAVTGIAGPDGGSSDKPVGTVYIAWQTRNQPITAIRSQYSGNRQQIRKQTVITAIEGVIR